jgi:hypothetical protein
MHAGMTNPNLHVGRVSWGYWQEAATPNLHVGWVS